ncbi:hypothetical protein D3C74_425390 [compost metagenome]
MAVLELRFPIRVHRAANLLAIQDARSEIRIVKTREHPSGAKTEHRALRNNRMKGVQG